MTTATVYSSASDGYILSADDNPTYTAAAHGTGSLGLTANDSGGDLYVGQRYVPAASEYRVYQSFLNFDLSGIPVGATVSGGSLSIYPTTTIDPGDVPDAFTVNASVRDWGASLTTADFMSSAGSPTLDSLVLIGHLVSSSFASGAYAALTNDSFVTAVQAAVGGTLRVIVWSDRQANEIAPTDLEAFTFASADASGTSTDPKLVVTYTVASAIKTINGLAKASVKTVNGLAIASVKTVDGLA